MFGHKRNIYCYFQPLYTTLQWWGNVCLSATDSFFKAFRMFYGDMPGFSKMYHVIFKPGFHFNYISQTCIIITFTVCANIYLFQSLSKIAQYSWQCLLLLVSQIASFGNLFGWGGLGLIIMSDINLSWVKWMLGWLGLGTWLSQPNLCSNYFFSYDNKIQKLRRKGSTNEDENIFVQIHFLKILRFTFTWTFFLAANFI